MKCSKCNKTWSLFDEKLSDKQHCPHCKEKFISKFQYFDSASEGIAYCLEMGGKEILKNKSKMNAYINDLMGNDFPNHNLVKNAIDSDIGSILIDADEKDEKAKQAAVQQAIGRLIREFSTEKKKAEEVVTYFTNALQWKLPAAAAEKTGAVNAAANPLHRSPLQKPPHRRHRNSSRQCRMLLGQARIRQVKMQHFHLLPHPELQRLRMLQPPVSQILPQLQTDRILAAKHRTLPFMVHSPILSRRCRTDRLIPTERLQPKMQTVHFKTILTAL